MLGELCLLSKDDSNGLTAILDKWFIIKDSDIVKLDEVDVIFEEKHTSDRSDNAGSSEADCSLTGNSEYLEQRSYQLGEQEHMDILLNHMDIEETMETIKGLLHVTLMLK